MAEKAFREGLAVLSRKGLSFEAYLYHPQIDELAQLAGSFPGTRIVLNHLGTHSASALIEAKLRECSQDRRHRSRR